MVSEPRLGFALRPTHARPPRAREPRPVSRERLQKIIFIPSSSRARRIPRTFGPTRGLARVGRFTRARGRRSRRVFVERRERIRRHDARTTAARRCVEDESPTRTSLPRATPDVDRRARDGRRRGGRSPTRGRSPFSSSGRDSSRVPYEGLATFPATPPTPRVRFHFGFDPRAGWFFPSVSAPRRRPSIESRTFVRSIARAVRIESSLSSLPTSPATEISGRRVQIGRASTL